MFMVHGENIGSVEESIRDSSAMLIDPLGENAGSALEERQGESQIEDLEMNGSIVKERRNIRTVILSAIGVLTAGYLAGKIFGRH